MMTPEVKETLDLIREDCEKDARELHPGGAYTVGQQLGHLLAMVSSLCDVIEQQARTVTVTNSEPDSRGLGE